MNFIHNEFQVNAYCDFEQVVNALDKVLNSYKIEYFHGYPSGIYEFIKQLKTDYPELLKKLRKNIKGIFSDLNIQLLSIALILKKC